MTLTRTRVFNFTALAVLALCVAFDLTYSDEHVGSIALLAWGVINLLTEGGPKKGEPILTRTVVVSGVTALVGLLTAIGVWHFSDTQTAQLVLILATIVNLFTEGGIADVIGKKTIASLLVVGLLTSAGCAHSDRLPAPESILTAGDANAALVKAQAVRSLLRDGVAEAHVAGHVSAAAVDTFDRYDDMFTASYRRARAAVNAGAIDTFREAYARLLSLVASMRGVK